MFIVNGIAVVDGEETPMGSESAPATVPEKLKPTLPFTIKVSEEKIAHVPDYMGPANPVDMDFPYCPVEIDGEYWVIYKNGYHENVFRFKGTNIENAVRQPDGVAPHQQFHGHGKYMLGGMWYDAAEKKLYAPMHCETRDFYSNSNMGVLRQIHLASSTDKGLTWKYEGPIITQNDPTQPLPQGHEYSGLYWDGGNGDFSVCVDARGGYVYVFSTHYLWPKTGLKLPCSGEVIWRHQVARCAMSDKLAPGNWHKFYNGHWNEPGLGGKASTVNAYVVTYNDYLKKFLGFDYGGGLAVCSDLAKQDWSPSFVIKGGLWGSGTPYGQGGTFAWHVTAENKQGIFTGGRTLFVYRYWQKQPGLCSRIEFGPGTTLATEGYFPEGGWAFPPNVTMDPRPLYTYEPQFESSDPIENRRTRRVGCLNPETSYSEGWKDEANELYYERRAKIAAKAGSSFQFAFTGKEVYWRPFKGPDCGIADVFLDGQLQETVDCYAKAATGYQYGFIKTNLDPKTPHSLRIVVRGEKNPLSTGTAIKNLLFEYTAESYRASDCYSSIQGKNNWSCQQLKSGMYTNLTFKDPNWVGDAQCEVGYFHMIPGANAAVRQWVAPHDGTVRVEGAPTLNDANADGFALAVLKNTEKVWSARLVWPETKELSCDTKIAVRAGDSLVFMVQKDDLPAPAPKRPPQEKRDETGKILWDPVITYLP